MDALQLNKVSGAAMSWRNREGRWRAALSVISLSGGCDGKAVQERFARCLPAQIGNFLDR
jgi:hypothetical protein